MVAFTFIRKNMHSKTKILHYIALNPGRTSKEVAKALNMKYGTVKTYVAELSKDKKITSIGEHQWRLCSHIPISSLRIPPEVVQPIKPWQIAYECITNMMRTPHVSQ